MQRKKKCHNLFDAICYPKYRYQELYRELVSEIKTHISKEEQTFWEDSLQYDGVKESLQSRFPDSMHTICDYLNVIAYSLYYDYGKQIYSLEGNRTAFCNEVRFYQGAKKSVRSRLPVPITAWDKLYRKIAYICNLSWEIDLLDILRKMREVHVGKYDDGFLVENMERTNSTMPTQIAPMTVSGKKRIEPADQCSLVYSPEQGKIIEVDATGAELLRNQSLTETYLGALKEYVKRNCDEIAQKVYCIDNVGRNERRKIERHFDDFSEFWQAELRRYGNNGFLSKAKLISAFQVFLMAEPKASSAIIKKGKTVSKTPAGYTPENLALSSSLHNSVEKDPFYLHYLCIWVDYQTLFNIADSYYAQAYIETSIQMIEAIVSDCTPCPLVLLQEAAEEALLLSIERLIPLEDFKEESTLFKKALLNELGASQVSVVADGLLTIRERSCFSGLCRLFGAKQVAHFVANRIKKCDGQHELYIPLREVSDCAILLNPLMVQVIKDETGKRYTVNISQIIDRSETNQNGSEG